VFVVPGLGRHFVTSVLTRDQTLILGVVMVYSALLLTFNLLVDVAYALVDPRIDVAGGGAPA
jgi:oligopeptide transport system permease protein